MNPRLLLCFGSLLFVGVVSGLGADANSSRRGAALDGDSGMTTLPPPPRPPKRIAMCVGINGYPAAGKYGPLQFGIADAKEMAKALSGVGYEVTLMTDEQTDPSLRPTFTSLRDKLLAVARTSVNEDDTFVFSFHGHGDSLEGQIALIPMDFDLRDQPQALDFATITTQLSPRLCRARNKLVIIDACRSGAERADLRASTGFINALAGAQNFVIFTACSQEQLSYEETALGHGRFTKTLLDGIRGEAFAPGREHISGDDWFAYVGEKFRDKGWAEKQTPAKFGRQDARAPLIVAHRIAPAVAASVAAAPARGESVAVPVSLALARGNVREAVAHATVGAMNGQPMPSALRAELNYRLGNLNGITNELATALAADAQDPRALRIRGLLAFARRDYQAAAADLDSAQRLMAEHPGRYWELFQGELAVDHFLALGLSLKETGRNRAEIAAAIAATRQIEASTNRLNEILLYEGCLAAEGKDYRLAREKFESVLSAERRAFLNGSAPQPSPLAASAKLNIGATYQLERNGDEAKRLYLELIQDSQVSAEHRALAHAFLGFAHGTNDIVKALPQFEESLSLRKLSLGDSNAVTVVNRAVEQQREVLGLDFFQWCPTEARSLSEPVEFANEPSALRQNEFKNLVMLSAL